MFCDKMNARVKAAIRQFDKYVAAHVDVALQVTTALKNALCNPIADIVTAIIPGEVDDVVRKQLVIALTNAIDVLTIEQHCKGCTDINEQLRCFAGEVKQHNPLLQEAILHKLASLVAATLDGQRLKQSFYDLYTQASYAASKQAA